MVLHIRLFWFVCLNDLLDAVNRFLGGDVINYGTGLVRFSLVNKTTSVYSILLEGVI